MGETAIHVSPFFCKNKPFFVALYHFLCYNNSTRETVYAYVFSDKKVSIRDEASNRIEKVIEELFQLRKRNKISQQLFEWRLNVKIAGCIHEKKKYGWMFYYSQITDLKVLYHLDWFVDKLSHVLDLCHLKI